MAGRSESPGVVASQKSQLSRIPVCPVPLFDECLSSWIERTACFYGCATDQWIGQFSTDVLWFENPSVDWDLSDEARSVLSAWSGISTARLPRLSETSLVLPMHARLTFCEQCWDDDAHNGGQPYVRRSWLNWATVHCDHHRTFLSSINRSVVAHSAGVSWQEVWSRKAAWRDAMELKGRGTGLGSLWFRTTNKLSGSLRQALVRFGDSTDKSAQRALDQIIGVWNPSPVNDRRRLDLPVILENRIEILSQAATALAEQTVRSSQ
jgi:hypothetical protein